MTSIDKRCKGVSKNLACIEQGDFDVRAQSALNHARVTSDCASPHFEPRLTTEQVAHVFGIEPQTVRKRWSQTGSYFGLKPIKLPNRRLMWSADAVAKFLRGEAL